MLVNTVNNARKISEIIQDIIDRKNVEFSELKPYLSVESNKQRAKINQVFAEAYFENKDAESLLKAKSFIERAWLLSGFSKEMLNSFEKINEAAKDYAKIREAYKRIGLKMISENKFEEALNYFNLFQSSYVRFMGIDKYEYDFDVLDAVHRMADEFRYKDHKTNNSTKVNGKIKIAYFLKGIKEVNSVLMKMSFYFAAFHDKSLFDVKFYIRESWTDIIKNESSIKHLKQFEECGYTIEPAPEKENEFQKSIGIAEKIYKFGPQILVGNAVVTNFFDYFVFALTPANFNLGIVAGPLPLFVSPYMDQNIALFKKLQIESPVDSYYLPLEIDLPQNIEKQSKESLGFSENSILIASAARSAKFQNKDYWKSVIEILEMHPNTDFVAIGIEKSWIPFLNDLIPNTLEHRFKFTGWISDFGKMLNSVDIFLDTYPTGSGVSFMDAMALGKPAVSFEHDQFKMFDQTDSSGSIEFFDIPELIVKRGDFVSFKEKISRLITDSKFREEMGIRVKEHIWANFGSPERMVKRLENLYLNVVKNKLGVDTFPVELSENSNEMNTALTYENVENQLKNFEVFVLEKENYAKWRDAYRDGYNSNMGDHSLWFYSANLAGMGLYNLIGEAKTIIEYGPSQASFMKKYINSFPGKKFYLAEYSTGLTNKLKREFAENTNVEVVLNYPEISSLSEIDLSFSFLLSQSMPRTLWKNHLKNVKKMLSAKGSYFFQFAYHPEGFADDQIQNGIYGNNKYKPEEIYKILEEAGYNGCDISVPITLEELNSDVIWYFCRAY